MGGTENKTRELEPNVIEQSKSSEVLTRDPNYNGSIPMECDRLVTETVEQKEVTAPQTIVNVLVSTVEISDKTTEKQPKQEDISVNAGAEKREPLLENVEELPGFENPEVASNGSTNHENLGTPLGAASDDPNCGKVEPVQIDVTNDSGQIDNEDGSASGKSRKRKSRVKGPVISSWSLRSKSQERPKAPEPDETVKADETVEADETVKAGSSNGEKKKKGRKKKQVKNTTTVNEYSRTRSHLRYLLHRIKYEQSLIDAYCAEGWKGQSLEKLKPEKELQRAKSHILRYKLRIRALFENLDLSLAVGKLPTSLFDSQGEIDSEDIFCAKCGSKELPLDNDIILCDGACERGFHQFCLDPPLLKEQIPPGDEGWLCPGCDCKVDCIDILKDFQGTKISILDSWEIFPEAAAAASGKKLDDCSGSSSDDAEDDDYDPDKPDADENNADEKVEGDESSSDESDYFSASDGVAAPLNKDKYEGLPSEDSEDDDFDPSAPDEDEQVKQDSSGSDFTSDSEDLDALLEENATEPGQDPGQAADQKQPSTGSNDEHPKVGRMKRTSLKDELVYLMETDAQPVAGKRQVKRLDYKKLLDETYGNASSDSSDEDFDDGTTRKRRKIDPEKSERKSRDKTPITKSNTNTTDENQKASKRLSKRPRKKVADGGTNESSANNGSSTGSKKRPVKRLGEATTQRLYVSFSENQYPQKAAKENLANELGITIRQVSKWFENARWSYNHRPQTESNSTEKKPPEPQTSVGTEGNSSNQTLGLENVVNNASGENSGIP
ncbi:hypothetical protein ABFS83_02G039800 [Erythranthe nasuta]